MIIALLIIIGAVVVVHELGHFLAARLMGAKVNTFSIGFGRPIIKWRDKKGTEWRIAWLPLGGFVGIYGQDDMFDRKKYEKLPADKKAGHYLSLRPWAQAIIIGAGVFMNMVFAWIIYTGLFMGTQTIQLPIVGASAAKEIRTGDIIMHLNGTRIDTWNDLLAAKEFSAGKEGNLIVIRDKKLVRIKMPAGKWGVAPDETRTETVRYGFFGAMGKAANELWTQSRLMITILKQMIAGERSAKQLGGIIHIADLGGRALAAGFAAMLTMLALVSVSIGIVNLMPLPVLDGGFLLILLTETVTRRKLSGRPMEWALRIGWGLLIALIFFTIWNDISRLMSK